jgi:hypothetical protein
MRLGALDVCHKTHTASIMLLGRRIQTVFLEMLDLGSRRHGALLKKLEGWRILQCNKSAKLNNWGQIPIKFTSSHLEINWGHIEFNSYPGNQYAG